MAPRAPMVAARLLALFASQALVAAAARAEEQAPPDAKEAPSTGLPSVPGLEWRFHLDATWGTFGFVHSLYTNPRPDQPSGDLTDNWFEGSIKPGLSASYTRVGELYGKISAVGERTYGTPPTLVGDAASSFQLDDLYVGWRSGKLLGMGENALDFTVGRTQYRLGQGFLIWDGTAEGGTRGGFWTNARNAFGFASVGRFKAGAHTVEAFYLVKDELPEAATGSKLLGFNYELSLGRATTLGATYLRGFAHAAQQREGMNVYNLRASTSPIAALPGLSFEGEYAREHNGSALDATGWTIQAGYEIPIAWTPRISYRFAFFQGDDPATSKSEAFDAWFMGASDWGTWWQGEIAGEYFISNSNLLSHQVRLHLAPSEKLGTGLIFYRFLFDKPAALGPAVTSTDVAWELDWYADWKANDHFTVSLIAAFASPGEGVAQAYGRTQDLWYGMIFAAYNY
jgi:hypothetical protein